MATMSHFLLTAGSEYVGCKDNQHITEIISGLAYQLPVY